MLTIISVFILRKSVNCSVNLFSNRNMNSPSVRLSHCFNKGYLLVCLTVYNCLYIMDVMCCVLYSRHCSNCYSFVLVLCFIQSALFKLLLIRTCVVLYTVGIVQLSESADSRTVTDLYLCVPTIHRAKPHGQKQARVRTAYTYTTALSLRVHSVHHRAVVKGAYTYTTGLSLRVRTAYTYTTGLSLRVCTLTPQRCR